MPKTDRRKQRTHEQLQKALVELIRERGYDALTIQDIAERANVGRTTFYLHYNSKEELFMSCHQTVIGEFNSGMLYSLSRQELLSPNAPLGMAEAYRHLQQARDYLHPIFQNQESVKKMRDKSAQHIEATLRASFGHSDSAIPLDVLANYLAGAQLALAQWWLEKRRPHTPEMLAQAFHTLLRAAVRAAFEPSGDS